MAVGRITFDGVWKEFRRGPVHDSLRDLVPALARRLTGRQESVASKRERFWALQDLSFDVNPGECLGIIGGNGAGKSTTLKILTGILQPTRGRKVLTGRVGSLIEVSAGFHPDLTGRENVFLQGAIMGMKRADILRRFDDIVDFSGIATFIDTPVKRYSSGMNARLGFSIAVHLEPEALIVDEVLSVGDASFQAMAFERLGMIVRDNVPAVIVSHQLDRVIQLCNRAILLKQGAVAMVGQPTEVIAEYLKPEGADLALPPDSPVIVMDVVPRWTSPVMSGARFPVDVHLRMRDNALPPKFEVRINVVALTDRSMVYAIQLGALDSLDALAESGHILPIELTASLPAGAYGVFLTLVDRDRAAVVARSRAMPLTVAQQVPFLGKVQMAATVRPS